LYHSAPGSFSLFAALLGGTVVVMPRFDPEQALHLIDKHRITSTFMAPTLVKRIVDLPESVRARYDVSSMRALIVAAAPCPMRVKEAALGYFGACLYEFYGSTELGINTILKPEDVLRKPGSCGRAAPNIEIALLDDEGRPVPAGEPGEVYVRRFRGMFDAYYKNSEATWQTERGGWPSAGVTWPTTRCRARCPSPRIFRATPPASSSRGYCAIPTGWDRTGKSDDVERGNRLREAFQRQPPQLLDLDHRLDRSQYALRDQDLPRLGLAAEPRSQVGHGADRPVVHPALEPDRADRGVTLRDADAEIE